MTGTFSPEAVEQVSDEVAVIVEKALGEELTSEQFAALAALMVPYINAMTEHAARRAWDNGHGAGMNDYRESSNLHDLALFGLGKTVNPHPYA